MCLTLVFPDQEELAGGGAVTITGGAGGTAGLL